MRVATGNFTSIDWSYAGVAPFQVAFPRVLIPRPEGLAIGF
jgi:hypothetical protein